MSDRIKPNYQWDWVNGMHIGYSPERIRVEGRGGAVEYVPERQACEMADAVSVKDGDLPKTEPMPQIPRIRYTDASGRVHEGWYAFHEQAGVPDERQIEPRRLHALHRVRQGSRLEPAARYPCTGNRPRRRNG